MSWNQYALAKVIGEFIKNARPSTTVGIVQFTGDVTPPAVLVIPIGGTEFDGSLGQDDMAMFRIQVSCIGSTKDMAAGMQSSVYRMLLGQSGGGYTAPLSAEGQPPLWRSCESQGPLVPGDQVYRTDDTYGFKEKVL